MSAHHASDGNSHGMILVVVLWAVAIMTVIVVALSAYSQKNLSLAAVETDGLRSEMAIQAGLDIGEAFILAHAPEDRVFLNGTPIAADVGGERMVEVSVMDAAGLVDINRADPDLIKALGVSRELSEAGAKAIIDGIMKLREARRPRDESAEQQQKDGEEPPQPQQQAGAAGPATEESQATAVFFSTSQLYGLEGADPADVDKLLPFITLYSSDGKVNPMAAPKAVMQSLGLSSEDADALAEARSRKQWKGQNVQEILERHTNFLAIGESRVFVIGVKATSGVGIIAGSRMQATVIFNEAGDVPFRILAWSW